MVNTYGFKECTVESLPSSIKRGGLSNQNLENKKAGIFVACVLISTVTLGRTLLLVWLLLLFVLLFVLLLLPLLLHPPGLLLLPLLPQAVNTNPKLSQSNTLNPKTLTCSTDLVSRGQRLAIGHT